MDVQNAWRSMARDNAALTFAVHNDRKRGKYVSYALARVRLVTKNNYNNNNNKK